MTASPRKKTVATSKAQKKWGYFLIPWLRFLVSVLYRYSTYFIGATIVLLIIATIMGYLFTKVGLILILAVLAFLALFGLNKWLDKR
jgi:hypothetical protein